jgi:hypothetical protein
MRARARRTTSAGGSEVTTRHTGVGIGRRTLDVLVATIGLALVMPLLAATALAIKVSSSGPFLFRQARLSGGRREFTILKFGPQRGALLSSGIRLVTTGPLSSRADVTVKGGPFLGYTFRARGARNQDRVPGGFAVKKPGERREIIGCRWAGACDGRCWDRRGNWRTWLRNVLCPLAGLSSCATR